MAGTYNFEIERGSTFNEQWKIPGFSSTSGVHSALTVEAQWLDNLIKRLIVNPDIKVETNVNSRGGKDNQSQE